MLSCLKVSFKNSKNKINHKAYSASRRSTHKTHFPSLKKKIKKSKHRGLAPFKASIHVIHTKSPARAVPRAQTEDTQIELPSLFPVEHLTTKTPSKTKTSAAY